MNNSSNISLEVFTTCVASEYVVCIINIKAKKFPGNLISTKLSIMFQPHERVHEKR